jgi:hypothetical protein
MTDFESGFPPKRAPSRRSYWRTIIFGVCFAFVLTILVCCYAVTMFAITGLKEIVDALTAVLEGFGGFFMSIVFAALMMIIWLLELLSLLFTGQLIPFVMRLSQLLGSS